MNIYNVSFRHCCLLFCFSNMIVHLCRVLLASKEIRSVTYGILSEILIGNQDLIFMFAAENEYLRSSFTENRVIFQKYNKFWCFVCAHFEIQNCIFFSIPLTTVVACSEFVFQACKELSSSSVSLWNS